MRLVQNGGRLLITEPTGEVVADHPMTPPGEASVLDEHYDGPRPAPSRGPRPKTGTEVQFCAPGPAAEAFIVGAAAIGNTRLAAELDVLLALAAAHGTQALVDALARAVAFNRFRAEPARCFPVPWRRATDLRLELPR